MKGVNMHACRDVGIAVDFTAAQIDHHTRAINGRRNIAVAGSWLKRICIGALAVAAVVGADDVLGAGGLFDIDKVGLACIRDVRIDTHAIGVAYDQVGVMCA